MRNEHRLLGLIRGSGDAVSSRSSLSKLWITEWRSLQGRIGAIVSLPSKVTASKREGLRVAKLHLSAKFALALGVGLVFSFVAHVFKVLLIGLFTMFNRDNPVAVHMVLSVAAKVLLVVFVFVAVKI